MNVLSHNGGLPRVAPAVVVVLVVGGTGGVAGVALHPGEEDEEEEDEDGRRPRDEHQGGTAKVLGEHECSVRERERDLSEAKGGGGRRRGAAVTVRHFMKKGLFKL